MDPLSIVVCVKQVPDSWAEKSLRKDDHRLDRDAADAVLNELDEYAVEEALRIKESREGETTVTVLSMGPERAAETLRKALSMGADAAVHLVDPALEGTDAVGTSYALAQALGTLPYDLVILGSESTDARMSVLPAMLAERLGNAQLTFARKVSLDGTTVTIERVTADGYATVRADLPAVLSVVEKINEPRYPSFKGIMAAKKKPFTTLSLAGIGADPAQLGLSGAGTQVVEAQPRPAKAAGEITADDGTGGTRLAAFLAAHSFA
ncbi:MAG: electron transfer flavoprotein beta subunit [Frankiales bacterium]|jgi:electron transfer flavoprotein beta subunit|nr:electron transfer flavoprotein beta subunit [Frankiales bacterium]